MDSMPAPKHGPWISSFGRQVVCKILGAGLPQKNSRMLHLYSQLDLRKVMGQTFFKNSLTAHNILLMKSLHTGVLPRA